MSHVCCTSAHNDLVVGVSHLYLSLICNSNLQETSLGQDSEIAAQYLNIKIADGEDYKKNEFALLVADNLRRVANLGEAHPFLSKYIVSLWVMKVAACD